MNVIILFHSTVVFLGHVVSPFACYIIEKHVHSVCLCQSFNFGQSYIVLQILLNKNKLVKKKKKDTMWKFHKTLDPWVSICHWVLINIWWTCSSQDCALAFLLKVVINPKAGNYYPVPYQFLERCDGCTRFLFIRLSLSLQLQGCVLGTTGSD